jgi:hypothetical protein
LVDIQIDQHYRIVGPGWIPGLLEAFGCYYAN